MSRLELPSDLHSTARFATNEKLSLFGDLERSRDVEAALDSRSARALTSLAPGSSALTPIDSKCLSKGLSTAAAMSSSSEVCGALDLD